MLSSKARCNSSELAIGQVPFFVWDFGFWCFANRFDPPGDQ